jgi:hypothetical protein
MDDPLAIGLALLPEVGDRWHEFEATVWSGVLDPVLLELCRVRVATLLRDDVGSSLRTPAAARAGVTDDLLGDLPNWPVSSLTTCVPSCSRRSQPPRRPHSRWLSRCSTRRRGLASR